LYEKFYRLRESCAQCSLDLGRRAKDTWALIYLTTAGMTGAIIAGMLIFRPFNLVVGRTLLALIALIVIVASLPSRKGIALAFNYYIELNSRHVDD
jgi:uncharacterized protein (DUF983 family)